MTTIIQISVQNGAITSSKSGNDANAIRTLDGMLLQNGYNTDEMDNQEKLDTALVLMIRYARECAIAYEASTASKEAGQEVLDNYPPPFED